MKYLCQSCGTALSRYNNDRLCFACQLKDRDSEHGAPTTRQLHQVPNPPLVIQITAASRLNHRRLTTRIQPLRLDISPFGNRI